MNQSKLHGQLKTMMEKIRSNKLIRQLMSYEYTDTTVDFCNVAFFPFLFYYFIILSIFVASRKEAIII